MKQQTYVSKNTTRIQEPTDVKRLMNDGIWEVRSSRYSQLWYKVVLDLESDKISCGCPAWKFHSCEGVCKHMLKVMEFEA